MAASMELLEVDWTDVYSVEMTDGLLVVALVGKLGMRTVLRLAACLASSLEWLTAA